MKVAKPLILVLVIASFIAILQSGATDYLTLSALQEHKATLQAYTQINPLLVIATYMLIYIISTALSIPGATILTLAGGALFGSLLGTVIILLSATVGACLAFLSARFIFRESLEKRYKDSLEKFNTGITNNALNYMLFLRLVPLFPFFLINLVMGLTRIPLPTFFLGSLIGMLPGTFVYANAGNQLSSITNLADILSPQLLLAFSLLGGIALIPTLYKKMKSKGAA